MINRASEVGAAPIKLAHKSKYGEETARIRRQRAACADSENWRTGMNTPVSKEHYDYAPLYYELTSDN